MIPQKLSKHLTYFRRWVLLSLIIGIVSGMGALIFYLLLNQSTEFFLGKIAGYHPPLPGGEASTSSLPSNGGAVRWWLIPLILTIGGLLSGFIIYQYAPEAEGHGTDAVISSFHRFSGVIRKRVPPIKMVTSIITIGTGGSAGREGPIAQIGAGFASWLAEILRLSSRDRRIMVVSGAAAGIGSIFKAPLGGAIFAIEVLYKRDFEVEAIIPAFLSSVVAYSVFTSFPNIGIRPIFISPKFSFVEPLSLIFYAILGLITGLFSIFYIKVFYSTRDRLFKRLKIPNHLKPALGGFFLGLIALILPQVLGSGYGWTQLAIDGKLALSVMLAIAILKVFATSLTISSGGSGGVFAPSLVIGSMLGGIMGEVITWVSPSTSVEIGAFVLVGMAAFFGGAAKVPIASMIMVSEMTGNYNLLVPLMLACGISYIVAGDWSIYESQVPDRPSSPAHRGEFSIDILEQMDVESVMTKNVISISPSDTIDKMLRLITSTQHTGYPVVEDGRLVGLITTMDIIGIPPERLRILQVKDVMSKKIMTVKPDERLDIVLHKMIETGHGHVPVVDRHDPSRLVGIVTKKDIIMGHGKVKERIVAESRVTVLDKIRVEEIMRRDVVVIETDTPISKLHELMARCPHQGYPVIENGDLVGMVTMDELLKTLFIRKEDFTVKDIAIHHATVTYPDETLHQALYDMYKANLSCIPVVDRKRPKKLLGMISKVDILRAYEMEGA